MKWVEKSSNEKISRLLEISERKHHYQVLLTRENISVVRRNPAPYTLPVIPRSLPLNVVEGEHFVLADVRRLVCGGPQLLQGSGNRGIKSGAGGLKRIKVVCFLKRGF